MIINDLDSRRCPYETVIDFDTARIVFPSPLNSRLKARCVLCSAQLAMTSFLKGNDMILYPQNIVCKEWGCNKQSFQKSGLCCLHLRLQLTYNNRTMTAEFLSKAGKLLQSAALQQWSYSSKYDIVRRRMDDILQK